MVHQRIDWNKLLHDFVELLGLDSPTRASLDTIAETLGTQSNAIHQIKIMLTFVDALEVSASHPREVHGGLRMSYRLTADEPEIRRRLVAAGLALGNQKDYEMVKTNLRAAGRMMRSAGSRRTRPVSQAAAPELAAAAPAGDESLVSIAGEEPISPFFGLRVLRHDEARAQVEVARSYRDRVVFIDAEAKRFEEIGLRLDRGAIDLQPDERLESIGLVLSYIERLEHESERLTGQLEIARQPSREAADLRRQVRGLKDQVERMVREKSVAGDAIMQERSDHRDEVRRLKRDIERLEIELAETRRANGSTRIEAAIDATAKTSTPTNGPSGRAVGSIISRG